MYLTINLACVLNWHLRILAIRPVPGGWRGPVPLRSRSGTPVVGCSFRLVWKEFSFVFSFVFNAVFILCIFNSFLAVQ